MQQSLHNNVLEFARCSIHVELERDASQDLVHREKHAIPSAQTSRLVPYRVKPTYKQDREKYVREIEEQLRGEEAGEIVCHRDDEEIVQDRNEDEEIDDQHQHPRGEDVSIAVLDDGGSMIRDRISSCAMRVRPTCWTPDLREEHELLAPPETISSRN